METIRNYVEAMFASFPHSYETVRIKEDLLSTMEEKYAALKAEGYSENEAVGTVISEFGNIDELMHELGMESGRPVEQDDKPAPVLREDEVYGYMEMRKRTGFLIGIGVAMILIGAALLVFMNTVIAEYNIPLIDGDRLALLSVFLFLVCLAPAIALFVYSDQRSRQYDYLKQGFQLPISLVAEMNARKEAFAPTYRLMLVFGVMLCVMGPMILMGSMFIFKDGSGPGVTLLLLAIAAAVFLFIYWGNIQESYEIVLKQKELTEREGEEEKDRVVAATAAIVWPLVTVVFLISGFVFHLWHIAWIVFPITGILFGAFSGARAILKKK